jgi:hypothetical protein
MRVVVANTYVPLEVDARERAAAAVADALRRLGHEPERIRMPFTGEPSTLVEELLALRLTDISEDGDAMIAVGAYAHVLRHRRKIVWVGPFDDGDGTEGGQRAVAAALTGTEVEHVARRVDRLGLWEAFRVLGGSVATRDEIRRETGVAVSPLRRWSGRRASADWLGVTEDLIAVLA